MLFVLCRKLFLCLGYLNICLDFTDHIGKRLDKKAKANFKIYDVTDWTRNNYNRYIAQCLKK